MFNVSPQPYESNGLFALTANHSAYLGYVVHVVPVVKHPLNVSFESLIDY
jgi:hypothetical protein